MTLLHQRDASPTVLYKKENFPFLQPVGIPGVFMSPGSRRPSISCGGSCPPHLTKHCCPKPEELRKETPDRAPKEGGELQD